MPKTTHLKRHIFVPYNGKIADITHADTNKHTLDLATVLSETRKIIAVIISTLRIAGTGTLYIYANEGTNPFYMGTTENHAETAIIANNTQRLQYALQDANSDWDLYCIGYVVEV